MHIPFSDNKNKPLFDTDNETVLLVYFNMINLYMVKSVVVILMWKQMILH